MWYTKEGQTGYTINGEQIKIPLTRSRGKAECWYLEHPVQFPYRGITEPFLLQEHGQPVHESVVERDQEWRC